VDFSDIGGGSDLPGAALSEAALKRAASGLI
jgi:hypothetical protein